MGPEQFSELESLFAGAGRTTYLGEPVSVAEHLLQSAALAEIEGAPDALVAAALLHDLGYLVEVPPHALPHEEVAVAYLADLLPAAVVAPIALHVAAKRYLCATEDSYDSLLSEASRQSLARQGGPFDAAACAAFVAQPFAADAVRLRRWDDEAKQPELVVPGLAAYRELLLSLDS